MLTVEHVADLSSVQDSVVYNKTICRTVVDLSPMQQSVGHVADLSITEGVTHEQRSPQMDGRRQQNVHRTG